MIKQAPLFSVALLLLAGCASLEPVASSPAPTAATPAATPSPTPTFSDPATWIIDYGRVGPLVVGGSLAAAEPSFGSLGLERQDACPSFVILSDPEVTLWVMTAQGDDDVIDQIVLGNGSVPDPSQTQLRTGNGIAVGSTLAEVTAAYPDVVESQGTYSRIFSATDGSGAYLNFSVSDSDIVSSIVVRSTPTVDSEYCGWFVCRNAHPLCTTSP
ncbi:hypothetical protein HDC94_001280 [Leifsonia sp. AK011]|uniref:hypothetical protein n=1 Tax=Leifsonia sp. AK011 TaxID=2723075 RepID=UPI0015CC6A6B|nr:hypothetical protein [Leifsonia sp. AK011]NYF10124.1 hypothetical protein [Leifsonia sp. AK011]